ncbi:MAG TPA: GWxTD domain-containing protein [Terriglobales bacterium]|nr:GWxTD domain-containing protein [Terriglobales bacterium]
MARKLALSLCLIALLISPTVQAFGSRDCYDPPKDEFDPIITPQERQFFYSLKNDEERDLFIDLFWYRRDPTPETYENEFRDEYYRRVIEANRLFSFGKTDGWKTERGHFYIRYGKPDKIERTKDGEVWSYAYIPELDAKNVTVNWIDVCHCGDLQSQVSRNLADALLNVPKSELSAEKMLLRDPKSFLNTPKKIRSKYTSLEQRASKGPFLNELALQLSTDFNKATDRTVEVLLKLNIPAARISQSQDAQDKADVMHIYASFVTLTGSIAMVIEREVRFDLASVAAQNNFNVEIPLYLRSGWYRIDLAVEDINSGRISTVSQGLKIPLLNACETRNK